MTRHRSLVVSVSDFGTRGPGSIPGWALITFFFFLFRLVMQNNFISLMFYIDFSSKFLGVGLNLALLKDIPDKKRNTPLRTV